MYYISYWNILVERTYIPSKSRFQSSKIENNKIASQVAVLVVLMSLRLLKIKDSLYCNIGVVHKNKIGRMYKFIVSNINDYFNSKKRIYKYEDNIMSSSYHCAPCYTKHSNFLAEIKIIM